MALSNMRTKLAREEYSSLADFHADVILIATNCFTYNASNPPLYKVLPASQFNLCVHIFFNCLLFFVLMQLGEKLQNHWELLRQEILRVFPLLGEVGSHSELPPAPAAPTAPITSTEDEISSFGHYVASNSAILLSNILTREDLLEVLDDASSAVGASKSTATHRFMMKAIWDYLTFLDSEGTFAAPVSSIRFHILCLCESLLCCFCLFVGPRRRIFEGGNFSHGPVVGEAQNGPPQVQGAPRVLCRCGADAAKLPQLQR
jgi:hypothetical protein